MARHLYLAAGFLAFGTGIVGVFVPLLPTVPFLILAAFCFGRGSPRFERWLLDHPRFGPPVRDWREHRAISRRGKRAALVGLAGSAVLGLVLAPMPWALLPLAVALATGTWIWRRPER